MAGSRYILSNKDIELIEAAGHVSYSPHQWDDYPVSLDAKCE